jgi:cytochrome c-type biogenesis protein CcmH/NrfG
MRYCNRTAGRRAGTDRRTFAELTLFSLSLFSFSFLCLLPAVRGQDEPPLETLNQQAAQAAQRREFPRAIELLDKVVARDATAAEPYYWRGRANFCAGKIDAAVADFDKYGELNPSAKSRQWERGIAQNSSSFTRRFTIRTWKTALGDICAWLAPKALKRPRKTCCQSKATAACR